jgi:anti-sigma B factor antagonist
MAITNIDIEQDNNVVVATVREPQLDANDTMEQLRQHMRNDGAIYFVIDMTLVEFVSSAVIGSFVEFMQDLESIRGRFTLCGCQEDVAFLFKVTRLDNIFGLHEDVQAAIEALKN